MSDIRVPSGPIESLTRDFALKRILAQAGDRFLKLAKTKEPLNEAQLQDIAQLILFLGDVGMSEWVAEVNMQRGAEGEVFSGWTKEIAQHQRDYEAKEEKENHAQAWAESQADQDFMQDVLHGREHLGPDTADQKWWDGEGNAGMEGEANDQDKFVL